MKKKDILDFVKSYYAGAQVTEFLESVCGGDSGSFIEIRMVRQERVKCMFYRNTEEVVKDLFINKVRLLTDWNVYFGICPRNERKGKEENVQLVNCLWADLDCYDKKKKQDEREIVKNRKARVDSLKDFKLHPSFIVNSGRGLHCYWLLEEPYAINDEQDFLNIKGHLKGLSHILGGDSTFDLSRCLRVPGTINLKNKNQPLPVEIIEFNNQLRYKLSQFSEFEEKVDVSSVSIDASIDHIPSRFWKVLEENAKLKATWEGKRKNLKDNTRSGYDMSLATLLMPYAFSDSEVASVLRVSPSGKGKEAKPQYLSLTIGKAEAGWKKREVESSKRQKERSSKAKFNPRPYSNEILEKNYLEYDKYKRFWLYDSDTNIWRDDAELMLNSILRKKILGEEDYKTYCVNEIIADLQGLTFIREELAEPEPYFIPFQNKIYDLKNNRLLDYSPDYFFINKLAISIDEEKKECPSIDKLFGEIVESGDVISLYEIAAYCFYRSYPYPKMFILYGSGGNGKGAYTKILARLLGKENISVVASSDLQNNRFGSSQLYTKMLNISSEMDYTILKNTSKLKKCSGEDLIYCERKFKEPFSFRNYAKMMFLTNQVPLTSDKTYAFYRRIFLLEFPYTFVEGETADPMIIEKIPREEFEGLAWKCLQILKEFYRQGFVFTKHEKIEEITRKYEDLSNPLNRFLEEFTEREPNNDIPVADFSEKYISYLRQKGFRLWSPREINKAMGDQGFSQKTLRGDKNTTAYKAWIEVKWK